MILSWYILINVTYCAFACKQYFTQIINFIEFKTNLSKGDSTMKRNMSNVDRIVRVVIAALFAYLYFGNIVTGALGIVLVVLAVVFVLTSILGFCPLYVPFKFSTYKS
jgi:hypothetical protein